MQEGLRLKQQSFFCAILEPRLLMRGGPAFPNRFAAELKCIAFGYHAAFIISLSPKYASSGVRFSSAV
ncbi:MAG: hypothetical protein COB39_04525 [Marinosulfonomonas sp.]|nr:MAG: hypothetical protein COB39_04525 [Marinosulfonomonas sp.]